MKKEIYRGVPVGEDMQAFEFLSVGTKGSILKRIEFIPTEEPEVYSLILGDVNEEGEMDLHIVSDNGDRNKILATVVDVVDTYCTKYPERWVYFTGSTKERTRLYRMESSKYLSEAKEDFEILGEINDDWEAFKKGIEYDGFLIRKKRKK